MLQLAESLSSKFIVNIFESNSGIFKISHGIHNHNLNLYFDVSSYIWYSVVICAKYIQGISTYFEIKICVVQKKADVVVYYQ